MAHRPWGWPWWHHRQSSAHFSILLDGHHVAAWIIQELELLHREGQWQLSSLEPAVAASVMPPVAVVLAFREGRALMGALHFNGAFIISFLYGLLLIILYNSMRQYQLRGLAVSSISCLPPQVLLGAGTLCALGREIVQILSWLPNLSGWHFHPVALYI